MIRYLPEKMVPGAKPAGAGFALWLIGFVTAAVPMPSMVAISETELAARPQAEQNCAEASRFVPQ
ncbi:MAG TPA: hypothetical protein VMZ25_12055 [Terriglobales bacterium]|nr:hypothetical protein [Terriglobales bacterium]